MSSIAPKHLTRELLQELARLDTCTLSNAIEQFNVRPRNEGFVYGTVSCRFPQLKPVIGYAVTARMRSSMVPVKGRIYYEHTEFWKYIESIDAPKIVAIQDADERPGLGALFGEAHARISRALGAVAFVTNGAVRDLPGIEALGFQLFSECISVSHGYAHVVEFGHPVDIGGLRIAPGDLLHGDLHGLQKVPIEVADKLPAMAEQVLRGDRKVFELTERQDFSVDSLAAMLEGVHKYSP